MNRIQSGDLVKVTTGKSKGHVGKVLKVLENRVIVEGANLITKHVKPNPNIGDKGGLVKMESAIHVSNVALYNSLTNKVDKVGFKFIERSGKKQKVRYFKSNDELVTTA
jgi:large subunit ribosomal protein L24